MSNTPLIKKAPESIGDQAAVIERLRLELSELRAAHAYLHQQTASQLAYMTARLREARMAMQHLPLCSRTNEDCMSNEDWQASSKPSSTTIECRHCGGHSTSSGDVELSVNSAAGVSGLIYFECSQCQGTTILNLGIDYCGNTCFWSESLKQKVVA
jgi:hypothetical protein